MKIKSEIVTRTWNYATYRSNETKFNTLIGSLGNINSPRGFAKISENKGKKPPQTSEVVTLARMRRRIVDFPAIGAIRPWLPPNQYFVGNCSFKITTTRREMWILPCFTSRQCTYTSSPINLLYKFDCQWYFAGVPRGDSAVVSR